jgi:hypothetical protein
MAWIPTTPPPGAASANGDRGASLYGVTRSIATRTEGDRDEPHPPLPQPLAGLGGALLASVAAAPAALAAMPPPDPGEPAVAPPPAVHTVVTGGMPGWQIALIAAGAALVAAVVAILLDRARSARRSVAARAA